MFPVKEMKEKKVHRLCHIFFSSILLFFWVSVELNRFNPHRSWGLKTLKLSSHAIRWPFRPVVW